MLQNTKCRLWLVLVLQLGTIGAVSASQPPPLLHNPDIHGSSIVVSAGGDLWIAQLPDGLARRLTSLPGRELFARFSPDGRSIAFTGEASGRPQVYVVPTEGGDPKQLTFDPSVPQGYPSKVGFDHQVVGWSNDGRQILFRSSQGTVGLSALFFAVSPEGGLPHRLPVPGGGSLSYSPDGSEAVYTPLTREFNLHAAWRGYHGGMAQDLWRVRADGSGATRLTQTERDEEGPLWRGNAVYFLAENGAGPMNVQRLDLATGAVKPITNFEDFDVRSLSGDSEQLVFERQGEIWQLLLPFGPPHRILPQVPNRPLVETVDATAHLESVALADDVTVLVARGRLFLEPSAGKGFHGIAAAAGSRDRLAALSGDGQWLAFVSDRLGGDRLFVVPTQHGEPRPLAEIEDTFLGAPKWSPDDRFLAVADNDRRLWVLGRDSSKVLVDQSEQRPIQAYSWSANARWLAYAKLESDTVCSVFLFDVSTGAHVRLSDGMSWDSWPAFDPIEEKLYFVSRRAFSPILGKFDLDFVLTDLDQVFRLDLTTVAAKRGSGSFSELAGSAVAAELLPIRRGRLSELVAVPGALAFRRRSDLADEDAADVGVFRAGKESTLPGAGRVSAAAQHAPRVALINEGKFRVLDLSKDVAPLDAATWEAPTLSLTVDRRTEWRQMVREAWRWERDLHFFRNLKQLGWNEVIGQFEPLVERALDRDDVNDLLGQMISRLRIGHLWAGGGDTGRPEVLGIRSVGATFRVDSAGIVRFDEVLDGAPYASPRGPLAGKVKPGEILLAIDGHRLAAGDDPYRLLAGKPGDPVKLEVSVDGTEAVAREIDIASIESDLPLRFAESAVHYRQVVGKLSGNRCGYVSIPNFAVDGVGWFTRQFYGQLDRPCLLIDERGADGGWLAETILERLARKPHGWNSCQLCGDWPYPTAAYAGVLVALTDGRCSSDGDIFAQFFREYRLGPLVGERTWGGVIGSHTLELLDGGEVAASDYATTGLDRHPEVENRGVLPDLEVVVPEPQLDPDRDPQLAAAVRLALDRLPIVSKPR
jgi:tricorn protease